MISETADLMQLRSKTNFFPFLLILLLESKWIRIKTNRNAVGHLFYFKFSIHLLINQKTV